MTQEEKSLLLKDLCTRLPYGVIVRHADPLIDNDGNETGMFWYKRGYLCDITTLDDMTTTIIESKGSDEEGYEHICDLERSLPYLRPMSSMTEEEREEVEILIFGEWFAQDSGKVDEEGWIEILANYDVSGIDPGFCSDYVDWLMAHHFDVRYLIEKGLALEAPKDMYKIE